MTDRAHVLLAAANAISAMGVALRELVALEQAEQEQGERLVDVPKAAHVLDVQPSTVRTLVREKKLASVKVGRLVRIPLSSLTQYQQRRRSA